MIGSDIVRVAALERLKFLSQRFDAWQDTRHGVRQGGAVGGYAHRRMDVTQRILDDRSLLALAEHEADRRRIDGLVAHQVIDSGEVKIELADVFWPEGGILQFDHHVAVQACVVEEQIHEELVAIHLKTVLTSHKRETDAEFDQEVSQAQQERLFDSALVLRLPLPEG